MDRINSLETEIAEIRKNLHEKEQELYSLKKQWIPLLSANDQTQQSVADTYHQYGNNAKVQSERLPRWAIERYSRQILLPDIGVSGQERLCRAKVLVVGAGGLGCPAAVYLAGAGVGEIGLVDYDTVDLTNIHRQILHGESDQHMSKVDSAVNTLRGINSKITITPYNVQLNESNALRIASKYDVILDCTDNVPTRYMLSDVSVLTKLPLISGSALKMEGQISIYGYRADKNPNEKDVSYVGPCYRCVFPAPPPAAAVGSCSANGVAGPVPGVMGALQALEAIKYIVGQPHDKLLVGRMVLFDGEDQSFRTVRLRPRSAECAACGDQPTVTRLLDYETFCQAQAKEKRKQQACLESQRRKEDKQRRMAGRSYLGVRVAERGGKRVWLRDVPKSERKIGPTCTSELCAKLRNCTKFTEEIRQKIFSHFWNDLDWKAKKDYVRSLIDVVPPKRRRTKHEGDVSRKGDSRIYHLSIDEKKLRVCHGMLLNTLGIKEASVRCWMVKEDVPKNHRKPIKALNVETYINNLPKSPPKCQICHSTADFQYVNLDHVKNALQLYNQFVKDMKSEGVIPPSRKTFMKVFNGKNLRFFKPKSDTDICDIVSEHNVLPSLSYQNVETDVPGERDGTSQNEELVVDYYVTNVQYFGLS